MSATPSRTPPCHTCGAPSSWVYYAQVNELVKIGFSTDVPARMRALGGVALAVERGGRHLEDERHHQFAQDRINWRSEYFRPSSALMAHVRELAKAGTQRSGVTRLARYWGQRIDDSKIHPSSLTPYVPKGRPSPPGPSVIPTPDGPGPEQWEMR